jgi:dTMP kinase
MSNRGLLISFEGCEGCGKTTQADILSERLSTKGYKVIRVREPGGTKTGEMIRGILQHDASGEDIEPETEVLLFAASRAQMVKRVVNPALAAGEVVISDRFIDSAVAYQGYGRKMGAGLIESVNALAIGGTMPDVSFLIDVAVQVGMERMRDRNIAVGGQVDRIERETIAFHDRVRQGYLEIAAKNARRFVLLDGTLPKEETAAAVWARIEPMLPELKG